MNTSLPPKKTTRQPADWVPNLEDTEVGVTGLTFAHWMGLNTTRDLVTPGIKEIQNSQVLGFW